MKANIESAGTVITGANARPMMIYDGVVIHVTGASGGKAARIDIAMRPEEALGLAWELIVQAEKHSEDTQRRIQSIRKRLNAKAAQ